MNWKTVSTLVVMTTIIACQDNTTAPLAPTSSSATKVSNAPAGRPHFELSTAGLNNGSADFTVGAGGGLFYVGPHAVYFPAGSICDPATSTYGMGTWDDACDPLRSNLTIHAEVRTTATGAAIDFTPSLRFVPSTNPSKWVWMYMYTPQALSFTGDLSRFTILYVPQLGAAGIDESLNDPTLRTYVDTRTGVSLRRIKHFSGYAVALNCDQSGGCTDNGAIP